MNTKETPAKIRRLRDSRRRYDESIRELQETGRRLNELLEIMSLSPSKVWNSTDRESVEFRDRASGELTWVSGNELRELPDKIGSALYLSRQIDQLEQSLKLE